MKIRDSYFFSFASRTNNKIYLNLISSNRYNILTFDSDFFSFA